VNQRKLGSVFGAMGLLTLTLAIDAVAHGNNEPPGDAQVELAKGASDLMTNTVIAALVQEIGETTPQYAAQGMLSISTVFDDRNHNMRLVGTLQPVRGNDYPEDEFEREALAQAMTGTAFAKVDRVEGQWYYRRSIPLSNFVPQCAMCHANFTALSSTTWVGALMLRVPIDGK